jgi:hypothetical protein
MNINIAFLVIIGYINFANCFIVICFTTNIIIVIIIIIIIRIY